MNCSLVTNITFDSGFFSKTVFYRSLPTSHERRHLPMYRCYENHRIQGRILDSHLQARFCNFNRVFKKNQFAGDQCWAHLVCMRFLVVLNDSCWDMLHIICSLCFRKESYKSHFIRVMLGNFTKCVHPACIYGLIHSKLFVRHL